MSIRPVEPLAEIQFHELKGVEVEEGAFELNGKMYQVVLTQKDGKHVTLSAKKLKNLQEWMVKSNIETSQLCALSKSRVSKGAKLKDVDQIRGIQAQYNTIIQGEKIQPPLKERVREVSERAIGILTKRATQVQTAALSLYGRVNSQIGELKSKVRQAVLKRFWPEMHEKEVLVNWIGQAAKQLDLSVSEELIFSYLKQNEEALPLLSDYMQSLFRIAKTEESEERMAAINEANKLRKQLEGLKRRPEFSVSKKEFEEKFISSALNKLITEVEKDIFKDVVKSGENKERKEKYALGQARTEQKLIQVGGEYKLSLDEAVENKKLFKDQKFKKECFERFAKMNEAKTLYEKIMIYRNELRQYLFEKHCIMKELSEGTEERFGADDCIPMLQAAFIVGGKEAIEFAEMIDQVERDVFSGSADESAYFWTELNLCCASVFD